MILVKGIEKSYGDLKVLKNINLEIEKFKITTIVGLRVPENRPYCT